MVLLIMIPALGHIFNEARSNRSFVHGQARVTDVERLTYSNRLTIRYGRSRYHVRTSTDDYTVGDILYVQGQVEKYSSQTIPFGFDAQRYYRGQGIDGYLETEKLEHIGHRTSFWHLRQTIKEKMIDHSYVRAYMLGEKTFKSETDETFRSLGLSFLLTMSGLHVYALIDGIKYVFFRMDLSKRLQDVLLALVLLGFLYVQAGSMSMVRILLSYVLAWLNRRYDWRYTRLDRLLLVFYVMLALNSDYLYHDGFIMTFLILFAFALSEIRFRRLGGYVQKLLLSTIVLLVTLPFYPRVLFLVVLLMPVFIFLFTKPLFYGAILVLFIPDTVFAYDRVLDLIERVLQVLEDRQVVFELPALSTVWTLTYYVFLYFFFSSRCVRIALRRLFLIFIVFGIAAYQHRYACDYTVYFLDVKQGDATVFVSPDCVLVIDSFQYTKSFLNDLGIGKINYLMLTHADQDHVAESADIIEGFRVEHVILSPYETYDITHQTIERPRKKTNYSCGVFTFDILGPLKRYDDGNDNSLIIQVHVYGKSYLFTGDAGKGVEADLVTTYGKRLQSDVLHVGHHGSDTSTSMAFLDHVKPDIGIISLGPNRHGFPHPSVMKSLDLSNVEIMRTDEAGTIYYVRRKNSGKWFKHIPNDT